MLASVLCGCLLVSSALSSTLFFKPHERPVEKVENVVCPDGQSQCPDGSTCCKLASGQYGCCPLPQAVCCSDHTHCCPSGTTCDTSQGKCNRGHSSIPWFEKQPSKPIHTVTVGNVVCPDGQSQCPDGSTCCKLASGQYGCCPLPQAVCCSDHTHCCPSGTTCDTSQGKCNRGEISTPWLKKQPALPRVNVGNVVCPDGQSQCPDGSTCCKLASGQYGCCPLPQAVCCSDHTHCCPSGTTCDTSQGKCNRGEISTPWLKKQPALPRVSVGNVVCPDGQSQCPDGSTCCKLASGQYGCCPLPQAVCCSDHTHCCPSGTTCDTSQGKCNRGEISTPWLKKQPALPRVNVGNVVCPDGQSQCPDGSTCCKLASGQYGCCPLPQAVCCSDHTHCCPSGTTCDTSQGKCNRGEISTPWLKKQPALPRVSVGNVVCPDGQSQCPDGSTCCKLASGQYGCCPLPQAVCCSDHTHCCPSGTTCDTSQGKCNRGEISTPWLKKQPALPRVSVGNVVCPDGQSQCPDGSTCCKLASGQYGCCPLPQAVCCSDHTHCCPSGTTCDTSQGKCNRGEISTSWLKKQPALSRVNVGSVMCPDGQSQCPDGSTCCKLASGQYGCCPLPRAVCCSDGLHCCPQGTTCDLSQGKCNRGVISLPWVEKLVAAARDPPAV
ncbi:progranulin-like isoform X2 [Liolophura sinensis]|uniref:progranulin-like isoform X2 n=1 Tax=Liolophura sinensis TaxID=3198878 RepID=UPI003158FD50